MKLRNKKTGEIGNLITICAATRVFIDGESKKVYESLAELNEEWEDYEEPKEYWYYDTTKNGVDKITHLEDKEKDQEIGNYFETKEEAEKAVGKLKAWKRLKDRGFKIKGWHFTPDMTHLEGNYVKIEAEVPQILINEKDLDLLFGGEE